MKILHVVEPGMDGVFRHVEGLIKESLKAGHSVTLAYSSIRSSDRLHALVNELEARGAMTLDLRVNNAPAAGDFRALVRLRRFIAWQKPDVVHAHSSKAGGLVRLPGVISRHRSIFYTPNAYYGMGAEGKPGLKVSIFNFVERVLGTRGTTINVSQDEASFARNFLSLPVTRQRIIPNGVDTGIFRPASEREKIHARGELDLPQEALVLGTVGRFSGQKDYGTLYRALIPIMARKPNLHFLHVGKGDFDHGVRQLIEVHGMQSRLKRLDYLSDPITAYRALDGFILTSRYEGLSYAILEALACNLPLLLSDAPGNRDFKHVSLSHAWFSAPGDIAGFSTAITRWMEDRLQPRPCNHHQIAHQEFDLGVCCARVLDAYREALRRAA